MEHVDKPSSSWGSRAWLIAAGVFVVLLLVLLALEPSAPYLIAALSLILAAAVGVTIWALLRTRAARQSYEERLTEWAAEKAVQAERLRIARDLHDVVGHQLTALSVNLQVASRTATGPAKDDLEVCRAVASDLLRDVREVVSQLRETPSAGPEFAEELRTIGHSVPSPVVDVDVADDLPPLGAAEADVVRRCIQEIVTNAVRHSGATSVWIAVEELDGVV
ncbi:MAG: histidine kinase, partial [Propionicimonas sp.]